MNPFLICLYAQPKAGMIRGDIQLTRKGQKLLPAQLVNVWQTKPRFPGFHSTSSVWSFTPAVRSASCSKGKDSAVRSLPSASAVPAA